MDLKINEVYTFKLNSGEEVIGKVTAIGDRYVELNEPLSVAPGPQGLGLIGSVFTSEPSIPVKLNINSVTMYTDTEDGIKVKYIETVTGLQVPSKKLILG